MKPVPVELGPFELHSYTVCMVTAVMVGGWLTYREAERRLRLTDETLMVGSIGLVGGVLGAKLSMVAFLGPAEFWRQLPTIPQHGAALTGALIGGYFSVVIAERVLKVERCTGDLVAPFILLSQAIGRRWATSSPEMPTVRRPRCRGASTRPARTGTQPSSTRWHWT